MNHTKKIIIDMKKYLIFTAVAVAIIYFSGLLETFIQLFKSDEGVTNWQHIANFSSGVLIIILSITAITLFFSRAEKEKANSELEAIKEDLEDRVKERTATLDRSNKLLKEEIEKHLKTSERLKASEHYINSILTSMPTMLVGLDDDGIITQWNETAVKYTGVSAADALGKDLWDAYPIITISREQVNEAQSKEAPTTIRQNQRGLFHFDITIYPLQRSDESGVVLLINDVSQQVKSENKLIQRDMMSSMGELASSMAHDMSAPLRGMIEDIGKIESQLNSQKDEKVSSLLAHAICQGQQASAIVANLLNFASSANNVKQNANISELVDHSIELAKNVLSVNGELKFSDIAIERDYDSSLPTINCHVSEIQQVLLSLLRHCYHALRKAGEENLEPRISVRLLESYDALWLKISHNGIGLTSEEQQSIFEPFFTNQPLDKQDDADKRLSFSYFVITEHHYGQMAVTSDLGVGTTFHIEFQLK